MKIRNAFLVFINFTVCSLSHAKFDLQGDLGGYYDKLGVSDSSKFANSAAGLKLNAKLKYSVFGHTQLIAQGKFVSDYLTKDSAENAQFNEKNFYLNVQNRTWDVRLGIQNMTSEGPDVVNPMDVVHPKNYKNPTSPESLGSFGVSLGQELSELSWVLFAIPNQSVNRLPGEKSIWWPREKRLPLESEFVSETTIPTNVDYKISEAIEVDSATKNNLALKMTLTKPSFDVAALYYEGLAQEPKLFFSASSTNFVLDSPIKLIPYYYKNRVVATSWSVPLNNFNIKGGANWIKPLGSDWRVPGEESTYVLGVEKNQEFRFGMVTWLIQFVRQIRQTKDQISFLRSIFEKAWIFGARVPIGEKHEILIGGTYDTVGKSSLGKFNYRYKVTEAMAVEINAQVLDGPDSSILGLYKSYDSYGGSLSYSF